MCKGDQSICIHVKGVLCGWENKVLYSCYMCAMWKGEQSICIHVKGLLCGWENKLFVFMLKVCYVDGRTNYLYSC